MRLIKENMFVLFLGCCVLAAGFVLVHVSQNVYDKQKKVNALSQNLLQAQWDVRSLNAELSYLSRPERLEEISSAMANASGGKITGKNTSIVVSPVSFHLTAPVVPRSKPYYAVAHKVKKTKTKTVAVTRSPVAITPKISQEKQAQPQKKTQDFTTFLDTIGGAE